MKVYFKVKGDASEQYSAVVMEAPSKSAAKRKADEMYGNVECAAITEDEFKSLESSHGPELTHSFGADEF